MNLFSPIHIRSLTLKNRIALSPMQQYSAKTEFPTTGISFTSEAGLLAVQD